MSTESIAKKVKLDSVCSESTLPALPTLPASNGAGLTGNVLANSNVTSVTKWAHLEDRPCWRVYDGWVHDEKNQKHKAGVWFHNVDTVDGNQVPVDIWICSPLHVDALTYDGKSREHGRLLRLINSFGKAIEWAMPMRMLKGSFEDGRGELLDMGLTFNPRNRNMITDYLASQHPKRVVIAASRTGWHNESTSKKDTFVMPDCIFGSGDVVFQTEESGQGDYSTSGLLDEWKQEIGRYCKNNPVLQISVCAALAGPLLYLLHQSNGGIHLVGDSSCGKTTALNVACSVWGRPDQFIKTWRATGNGLEGIAALRNDTCLMLDEIGEADPREIGGIVYALGNGAGKQRANVKGNARKVNRWRLFILSSGERTLEAIMSEAGKRTTAGQQDSRLDYWIFQLSEVTAYLMICMM